MAAEANRRKIWIAALGALLLLAALATLNAFNTQLPSPATTQQIVIFTGLSIVAFLLFVAVMILLVRNVLRLYADQRSRVMGTRLRTRMLWGAVLVSLIPIASMFAFSYLLLNRAVDRWFSQPVTEMRDDSNNMALELSRYTSANARAESDSIAASLPETPLPVPVDNKPVVQRTRLPGSRRMNLAGRSMGRREHQVTQRRFQLHVNFVTQSTRF
jgi:hypothetical protein